MTDKEHVLSSLKMIHSCLGDSITKLLAFMNKAPEENLKELELIGYGISYSLGASNGLQKYLKEVEFKDDK